MKKIITMIIALAAVILSFGISAGSAGAAGIQKTEYEGKGRVEVNFSSKIEYGNLKIKVKDSKGKKVKCEMIDTDDDDLEFRIKNYKQGKTYSYKISGIRERGTDRYISLSGKITIPKAKGGIPVKKVEYDPYDNEVSFEFDAKVKWNSPKVTITNGKTQYVNYFEDRDNDEIEVSVKNLAKGVVYNYTISGIKKSTGKGYTSVSGTFSI